MDHPSCRAELRFLQTSWSDEDQRAEDHHSIQAKPQILQRLSTIDEAHSITRSQPKHKRSLLCLCIGVLGRHLEDILDELGSLAEIIPASLKMTLLAISRRRGLLGDDVLLALIDESWEILDVSGSEVTDIGLQKALEKMHFLKAVDFSRCSHLTSLAIQALVQNCPMLHTLRCGGTALSNAVARKSVPHIVPGLNVDTEAEDSWENLELEQLGRGAQALRWLVWPAIDEDSQQQLALECPKVVVNPTSSPAGYRHLEVPPEAFSDVALDDSAIIGIDPETWSMKASTRRVAGMASFDGKFGSLSIAERFKLAFTERDERLASKRAKNSRQNQRRAEKAWLESDLGAKSVFWAGVAQKSLKRLA